MARTAQQIAQDEDERRLAELHADLQQGLDDLKAGRSQDTDEFFDELLADLPEDPDPAAA